MTNFSWKEFHIRLRIVFLICAVFASMRFSKTKTREGVLEKRPIELVIRSYLKKSSCSNYFKRRSSLNLPSHSSYQYSPM